MFFVPSVICTEQGAVSKDAKAGWGFLRELLTALILQAPSWRPLFLAFSSSSSTDGKISTSKTFSGLLYDRLIFGCGRLCGVRVS